MAKKKRSSHARVRVGISSAIASANGRLSRCADDLALGIHPWIAGELTDEARDAIIGELNPWSNVPHPDVREVVADRLFRLAEVARGQHLSADSCDLYESAAQRLVDAGVSDAVPIPDPFGWAVDPMGIRALRLPTEHVSTDGAPDSRAEAVPDSQMRLVVGRILLAASRSGSIDIGVELGQSGLGVSVDYLIRAIGLPPFLHDLDEWFAKADPRKREILNQRVFASTRAKTLELMGTEWGLTRERIRQIETKAKDEFTADLRGRFNELEEFLAPLRNILIPAHRFEGAIGLLGTDLDHGDEVAAAIAWIAGPWHRDGEWTYHASLRNSVTDATTAVPASADQYGLIEPGSLTAFNDLFLSEEDRNKYLTEEVGIVSISGYWEFRDSWRAKIAAALKRIGRPATKLEVGEEAGLLDEHRVGSILSVLPEVVRADKERWGFAEWVDDAYDGIVGEINQRIDANNGSASVASLLYELPQRFGVSPNSVELYLQTPAFVVEDGLVRRAAVGEYDASPPGKWPDARWRDGMWGQRLRVEQRHFEGYSLRVRFDIAYANGLRPDCDLKVPLEDDDTLVSVIWRAHDTAWLIDVGRISDALVARGFQVGESIFVSPGPEVVRLARWIEDDVAAGESVEVVDYSELDDPLFGVLG